MKLSLITSVLLLTFLFACQSGPKDPAIQEAQQAYESEKNPESGLKLITAYINNVNDNKETSSQEEQVKMITNAIAVAEEQGLKTEQTTLMQILIRDYFQSEKTPEMIYELSEIFANQRSEIAARALKLGLIESFPEHEVTAQAKKAVGEDEEDIDAMIENLSVMMLDTTKKTMKRDIATAYVNVCEAHALTMPKDEQSPLYLQRAAEIARSLGNLNKAMNIYDWLLVRYPDDPMTPAALFLKAQTLDDMLDREDEARPLYEEFIATYPDHHFVDDAEFQLEMLGKSDEEVLQEILKRSKEKENQPAN